MCFRLKRAWRVTQDLLKWWIILVYQCSRLSTRNSLTARSSKEYFLHVTPVKSSYGTYPIRRNHTGFTGPQIPTLNNRRPSVMLTTSLRRCRKKMQSCRIVSFPSHIIPNRTIRRRRVEDLVPYARYDLTTPPT